MGQNADLSHEKKTTARNPDHCAAAQESQIDWAVVRSQQRAGSVSQSGRGGQSGAAGPACRRKQKGSTAALRDRQTDRGTRLSRGLPSGLIHRSYLYLRAGGVPTRHTHEWDGLHTRHLLESTPYLGRVAPCCALSTSSFRALNRSGPPLRALNRADVQCAKTRSPRARDARRAW